MGLRGICLGVFIFSAGCGGTTGTESAPPTPSANEPTPPSPAAPSPTQPPTPAPAPTNPPSGEPTSACGDPPGTALLGVTYDLTKSRFAFGGPPTKSEMNGLVRWVGPQGTLAISPLGDVHASMNAGASSTDWSLDPVALTAHVRAYLVSLGVANCQIARDQVLGGSNGMTISLARAVDAIAVVSSTAAARMNTDDQSTYELVRWPAVPSATIAAAKTFRDQLADPTALAAYRAKLPPDAQGDGLVVIHHTVVFTKPMRFDVTWDVSGAPATRSFDVNGAPVSGSVW